MQPFIHTMTKHYTILMCRVLGTYTIMHNKSGAKKPLSSELSDIFEAELDAAERFYTESSRLAFIDALCRDYVFTPVEVRKALQYEDISPEEDAEETSRAVYIA